jgi:hypothetical protein
MDPAGHPIIYVRGYAMTEDERNETAADPFCGFNLGSTVYRANIEKSSPAKKFVFESPVLRLAADYGYRTVYENGLDILDPDWKPRVGADGTSAKGIPQQSIVIYRYYDDGSDLLGDGKAKDIETYARGLSDLVLKVKALVCERRGAGFDPATFRCYLVAHSMGGLVVRAFLQNRKLGDAAARASVDKVFTYATPHNGIDLAGFNTPSWLSLNEMNTFNRERMAGFLDLKAVFKATGRVDFMPDKAFPASRMFCMVGTNRGDYEAGRGLSRAFAGHGSDGLVRIENATVWGVDDSGKPTVPAAVGYAYRAHSGPFGIVNSEEAYQNLTRFLFGDVRVDIWVDVAGVAVPPDLEGRKVQALYQVELLTGPRGKRWYLSRRTSEEDSPACRTHAELTEPAKKDRRSIYLSTVFLANRARVDQERPSLAYAMTIGVRVPDYQVEKVFWPDQHYEGGYLFRDTAIVEMVPPAAAGGDWSVKYSWQSDSIGVATTELSYRKLKEGKVQVQIPFDSGGKPGISGKVRLVIGAWNT